jgi:8-oxo-dGTP pyrophosphatase MutT (NUDIX family)
MGDSLPDEALPAASVVVLKPSGQGFDVLLLRRNPDLSYLGGAWVFPGGRVEKNDEWASHDDVLATARRTAIRETREECGLVVEEQDLIPMSLWITPDGMPKRFSTVFFLTRYTSGEVCVDGSEIHGFRWITPAAALNEHKTLSMILPPPVFVTLTHFSQQRDIDSALSTFKNRTYEVFRPKIKTLSNGFCSVYEDDAMYHSPELESTGRRHRLYMLDSGWTYIRD